MYLLTKLWVNFPYKKQILQICAAVGLYLTVSAMVVDSIPTLRLILFPYKEIKLNKKTIIILFMLVILGGSPLCYMWDTLCEDKIKKYFQIIYQTTTTYITILYK